MLVIGMFVIGGAEALENMRLGWQAQGSLGNQGAAKDDAANELNSRGSQWNDRDLRASSYDEGCRGNGLSRATSAITLARGFTICLLTALLVCAGTQAGEAATDRPTAGASNPATIPSDRLDVPWWAARHRSVLQRVSEGNVDLVFIGDSITQRLDDPRLRRLWDWYYGDRHAINLGFSGDTTANVLWRLEHGEIDGIDPKVVVLMIGLNNTGHLHERAPQVEQGINAVVQELETRLPKTHILLLGILPTGRPQLLDVTDGPVNADLARTYAHSDRVTFLNVGSVMMNGDHVDPMLYADRFQVHPSVTGQNRICIAIEPTLSHLLGDHQKPPL
jgi:lysophospholipase L1-like esterase